jgi:hypothetical protein
MASEVRLYPVPLYTKEHVCWDCGKLVAFVEKNPAMAAGKIKVSLKSPYCKIDEHRVVVEAPNHRPECSRGPGR